MGRGGALVEEAKRLMADDDDGEMPAQNQERGPLPAVTQPRASRNPRLPSAELLSARAQP